ICLFSMFYLCPRSIKDRPSPPSHDGRLITITAAAQRFNVNRKALDSKLRRRRLLVENGTKGLKTANGTWHLELALISEVLGMKDPGPTPEVRYRKLRWIFERGGFIWQAFLFSANTFFPIPFITWTASDEFLL